MKLWNWLLYTWSIALDTFWATMKLGIRCLCCEAISFQPDWCKVKCNCTQFYTRWEWSVVCLCMNILTKPLASGTLKFETVIWPRDATPTAHLHSPAVRFTEFRCTALHFMWPKNCFKLEFSCCRHPVYIPNFELIAIPEFFKSTIDQVISQFQHVVEIFLM